jgi:hypothetical protein
VPIDRSVYDANRPFRFGQMNPEWINNPGWEYMVRTRQSASAARNEHEVGSDFGEARDFCFDRLGSSLTPMADGRMILIGGEHEDYYDPDFIIFNDVVVLRPAAGDKQVTLDEGSVEIYGYPRELFPPIDFHSATLVGDKIYIIGGLGYSEDRRFNTTPVFSLDTTSYRMERVNVAGLAPGWIYQHFASFEADRNAIAVRGGMVTHGPADENHVSHSAFYRLHLDQHAWELVSPRERHRRFWFQSQKNALVEIEEVVGPVMVDACWLPGREDDLAPKYHLAFDGVRVKFNGFSGLRMRVEGELPTGLVDGWVASIKRRLEETTSTGWSVEEVDDWKEANRLHDAEVKESLRKLGLKDSLGDYWLRYDEP